jgi:hypothetical protein
MAHHFEPHPLSNDVLPDFTKQRMIQSSWGVPTNASFTSDEDCQTL